MAPIRLQPGDSLGSVVPPEALTWVSGCSAHSEVLSALAKATAGGSGPATYTGIFVAGLNRDTWAARPADRVRTYFLTPELKQLGERCDFRPLCYADIGAELAASPPDCAMIMVSPPDEDGRCSFGTCVDFIADLWRHIPLRVAHINPAMPRTRGDAGIPFDEITAYVEADQPLAAASDSPADEVTLRIAALVAEQVPDGATIQTGLGKLPGAVLRALCSHSGLAIHSGLIGDPVLDLLDSGAMRDRPVVAGVAIGTDRLYARIGEAAFAFHPPSVTHDLRTLAGIEKFVAINSALEVDLFGQAYAELGPRGFMSGPGGASDFARGAKASPGGLRIVLLPSAAGAGSRIVMPPRPGPVSLGRMDIDLVVTEHGVADLRGGSHDARARALVAVAAPQFRDDLSARWAAFSKENL